MILLDIMKDDKFICQIPYSKKGEKTFLNGKIEEVYDIDEIERYVYEKRPSLKGQGIRIRFSNQRTC